MGVRFTPELIDVMDKKNHCNFLLTMNKAHTQEVELCNIIYIMVMVFHQPF